MRVSFWPSSTSVGSATGANTPTASIPAVSGHHVAIFGIDVSCPGSAQIELKEVGGAVLWGVHVTDFGHFDFGPAPIKSATKGTSLFVSGPQPGAGANTRISVRYAHFPD